MADKVLCEKSDLVAVANAIRGKNGTTNTYKVNQLAGAVENIKGGSTENKLAQMVERSITTITEEDLQGATSIGPYAFYYYESLTSITMPNSVTNIGESAFYYCKSLTSITIGSSVTKIGYGAFYWCSNLKSITLPNSVTSIGERAFFGCSGLTNVTLPNSVTIIGNYALQIGSPTNKATIIMKRTTPPTISSDIFYTDALNKIIVPKGTGNTYKSATNWSAFASYIREAT